jgi:hypothetical protein
MTDDRSAEEIFDSYEEIRAAHRAAEEEHRRITRYYHEAVLENIKAREAGGFPDPHIEQRITRNGCG